jgi:large subunit ribosomal protein L18
MKHRAMTKKDVRKRRHARVRARVIGSAERPRLAVHKSNKFVSAQLINDEAGKTLASAHGREFKGSDGKSSKHLGSGAQAAQIGKIIAERAKEAGITAVVFDRGGYRYAGQVKALADAARESGLTF